MKSVSLLLALMFLTSMSSAQIGWFEQHTDGEDILFSVDLLDASTVTAVGENGLILHSTDAGDSWTEISSGTTQVLRRVRWYSPSLGIILGNGGTALKSTDAGQSWTTLNTGVTKALFDVHFFDADNWLLVGQGAQVLTTDDGGSSFSDEGSGLNNYNEIAIRGDFGIIVGNKGTARRTRNGGEDWGKSTTGVSMELTSVSIGNDSTAVAVGANGTIIRTTDEGKSWDEIYASVPISQYRLSAVRFLTENHVVFAGYGGLIFESFDGGITWTPQESNTQVNIEGLSFIDSKTGNTAGWQRNIMRTQTGGSLPVTMRPDPLPAQIGLSAAWPNPVSRSAHAAGRVSLELPSAGPVTLAVYDLLGRERSSLLSRTLQAGSYTVDWNPGTLENGVYLIRLAAQGSTRVRKFTVID